MSPEARERKRERARQWERSGKRVRPARKREIEAQNGRWLVLCCKKCFGMFDVEDKPARLPDYCPECRGELRKETRDASRRKIAA